MAPPRLPLDRPTGVAIAALLYLILVIGVPHAAGTA